MSGDMTWAQAAAEIERIERERQEEYERKRAAIIPHVRKPLDRTKLSRHSATSPHNRVPLGAGAATYCGAPTTTEDWDRREAVSAKHAAAAAERGVCPDCITIARTAR